MFGLYLGPKSENFGEVVAEEEQGEKDDENGKALAQPRWREAAGEARADKGAAEPGCDKDQGERQVQWIAGEVTEQTGRAVRRDHDERRADGLVHRQADEEDECRNDEKSAADAEDAGEQSNACAACKRDSKVAAADGW